MIGLIRRGEDVISSVMGRSEKTFRVASYRWRRSVEVIHELATRFPQIVLVVSFEGLVLHPKENMERVAVFLNVEYQDRMLEGPQYNPWYPEEGMNPAKVNRAKRDKIDVNLSEGFPKTFRQYQELLKLSERAPLSCTNQTGVPAHREATATG